MNCFDCKIPCELSNPLGECLKNKPTVLAPGVEYYPGTKDLLLIRCPKCGKENYALNVSRGICTWCGYDAHELLKEKEK